MTASFSFNRAKKEKGTDTNLQLKRQNKEF